MGVKQTLPFLNKRFLLLDIGGGSNEFIIADGENIFWKRSFKLGMARLLEKFKPSDPITTEEIVSIETYLNEELTELFEQVNQYKPQIFIGASGSFDTFVNMLASEGLLAHQEGDIFHAIPLVAYQYLHDKLIHTSKDERAKMSGLEPIRRDMIVLASIFVNFVLNQTGIKNIYQSAYSLKEGAVFEMMNWSQKR